MMPVTRHGPRKVGLRFFQSTPTLLVLYTYGRAQLRDASSTNYNKLKYDFQSSKASQYSPPQVTSLDSFRVPGPMPLSCDKYQVLNPLYLDNWNGANRSSVRRFVLWYTLPCGWVIFPPPCSTMFGESRYYSRDWDLLLQKE